MNHDTPILPQSQQTNVKNWQDFDLSTPEGLRALDRYIAPLAGWTCKLESELGYYLRSPEGSLYQICPITWCATPEETIAHVWKDGWIPKYTTDLNAAMKLCYDMVKWYCRVQLTRLNDGSTQATITYVKDHYERFTLATAENPALAICKAWLAWYREMGGAA